MARRILLSGLAAGAFVLTLGVYAWQDRLWRTDAAPVTPAAPAPHAIVPAAVVAAHSSGLSPEAMTTAVAAPPPPAMDPPPPPAAEPVQTEPQGEPPPDDAAERARSERGSERGSRSR